MDTNLNNTVVYIITKSDNDLNYRAKKLLELNKYYTIYLISNNLKQIFFIPNMIEIKSYKNIFNIFKKMRLNSLTKYLNRLFYFPSTDILYVAKVTKYLKKQIKVNKNKKIVLVIITPPHDLALCGFLLKKKFPFIKFINDLQDFWTYDEYYFNRLNKKNKIKALKSEQNIFNFADYTVVTNEFASKLLEENYSVPKNKIVCIHHPFDFYDLKGKENTNNTISICQSFPIIGFLGNFIKPPKVLGNKVIEALKLISESGIEFEIRIFGDESIEKKEIVESCRYKFVKFYEWVTHNESLSRLNECDLLLIILEDLPNSKIIMHGKLPHYLCLKKPIIALVPADSFVAHVIKKTKSGWVIPSSSDWVNEIKNIIVGFSKGNNIPEFDDEEIQKYSWENISKKWMEILIS